MSSQLLKCVNCNVVINEVLAFICNKLDVMDEESVCRICVSAFLESDITIAKNLLFSAVKTKKRNVQRRKDGKKLRDIEDIIGLLQVTHPDERPVFVAKELHKLPPVLFDHIDVTKLLKDLVLYKKEIDEIKRQYVTIDQIDIIKAELEFLKSSTCTPNICNNVNFLRGGRRTYNLENSECNSGPIGLPHIPSLNNNTECEYDEPQLANVSNSSITLLSEYRSIQTANDKKASKSIQNIDSFSPTLRLSMSTDCDNDQLIQPSQNAGHIETEPAACVRSEISELLTVDVIDERAELLKVDVNKHVGHTNASTGKLENKHKTFSEIVKEGEWKMQRNRVNNRFIGNKGTAIADPKGKFKAVNEKVVMYIYHVDKEVTGSDIVEYVRDKSGIEVDVEKMYMKILKSYDSYKIFVPKLKLELFMKESFWPEGISFRKFIGTSKNDINKSRVNTLNAALNKKL